MLRKYSRTVAVLLLLVFCQKAGLRMWMHHWFHESRVAHDSPAHGSENLKLKCDCFDDAMMPLLESPLIIFPAPVRQLITLTINRHSSIVSTDDVYYSLKGPPMPAARA
jgi:hypothetical protein